jgi:glycerophosphoryl diester phosphodiesterase
MTRPLVIAHRGASGYELENSLAAFRAAGPRGADGVELDVHSSLDGELFVHHDDCLADGRLISQSRATDVVHARLANGELLPTLSQTLAVLGDRLLVFVELKTLHAPFDQNLLAVLASGPNPSGYAIHSFDHRIVVRVGRAAPTLGRGVLNASYGVRPVEAMVDAGASDLWQEQSLIDAELATAVHRASGRLIAWTVNTAERMQQLVRFGVDGICTNYPDVARRTVDALAA